MKPRHDPVSDEAERPRHEPESTGSALLQAALTRENLQRAWKRVGPTRARLAWTGWILTRPHERLRATWPRHPRTTVAGDVPAQSGATGNDSEAGGWRARAWHPDGDGSADPAGAAASAAADT